MMANDTDGFAAMTAPVASRRDILAGSAAAGVAAALPGAALAASVAPGKREFVWGVAASAPQTESRQGRGRSNWDVFADTPGKIRDGSTNARNAEFERRYPQDLDLLKSAGIPAFRISLAWPRIQPDGPGKPSQAGLDHYRRVIDAMLERGIEPWVTLFHWDMPTWAGDFRQRDAAARLADYADATVGALGDRVKRWIVFNEPNTVALLGYGAGRHAPGLQSPQALGAAVHHQNLAIGLMVRAARSRASQGSLIGTTHNVQPVKPKTSSAADAAAAARFDVLWNKAFLDPLFGKEIPATIRLLAGKLIQAGDAETIAAPLDFLGVNYYSRFYIEATTASPGFREADPPSQYPRTDFFWVEPDGLTEALVGLRDRYGPIPLYITEAGFAIDSEKPMDVVVRDDKRLRYLDQYIGAAAAARAQGVDLRGFFQWASTDNWEWGDGFTKRFGLIAVDVATQMRRAKRSLPRYPGLIRKHFPDAVTRRS